jgi:acetoin utilization deacetylase AcuC-like enzyme
VLEGGYDPDVLAGCVLATIAGYDEGQPVETADPAAVPAVQAAIVRAVEDAA